MFKSIILAVVMALSMPVLAALQATSPDGSTTVILREDACLDPMVLQHIPPEYQAVARKVDSVVNGKPQSACAGPLGGQVVVVVWDDGDSGQIPLSAFKERGV